MQKLNEIASIAKEMAEEWKPTMTVNVKDILAIADAYSALELENIKLKQGCENSPLVHEMVDWRERAEAAEAKLQELDKQEPVAWGDLQNLKKYGYCAVFEDKSNVMGEPAELFTRPAPAVNLAELVPFKKITSRFCG